MKTRLDAMFLAAMLALVSAAGHGQEAQPRPDQRLAEARDRMQAISPLAKVHPPNGVEMKPKGSSESPGNYRQWNALARGSISPLQLIEHYTSGLATAGWSFHPPLEEGTVALQTGEYRDSEGVLWHVLVLSAPSFAEADACSVTFRLTQISAGAAAPAP
jgi:hypothetical protein